MKILYYDCFAGISGDMNLGALIDLGVDADYVRSELGKLNIDGFALETRIDKRREITGIKADVIIENPDNETHRHLHHIVEILENSDLSPAVKDRALEIFKIIARAEAEVHGIDIERVHFHEVGALDSIADIVGAAICLEYLEVDRVLSSPVQLGGGSVRCAHGVMPVPAPATARIVEGMPVKLGLVDYEATTPTGAAILRATVDEFTTELPLPISRSAYGLGTRDGEVANVLRVYLLEAGSTAVEEVDDSRSEIAVLLECNIDDMNPEHYDYVLERLFSSGASDAWLTPIVMKKSRPAVTLSVLCSRSLTRDIKSELFIHSTTLGIRETTVTKHMLRRNEEVITTSLGRVNIKTSYFRGMVVRQKPESDDCRRIAGEQGMSIAEVEATIFREIPR